MIDLLNPLNVFFALIGGIFPALLWLWFWLKEDSLHPEPRTIIMLAFLVGMLATALSYPLEMFVDQHVISGFTFEKFFLWACIEEGLKWAGIVFIISRTPYFDEPIDAVIYFVTTALGFAALENAMFLLTPLGNGDNIAALRIENFRFIGATLLHVASSAIPGIMLATVFFRTRAIRLFMIIIGLFGAIALHTLFNFSIINSEGRHIYWIFLVLWCGILVILYACEKIKRMAPKEAPAPTIADLRVTPHPLSPISTP